MLVIGRCIYCTHENTTDLSREHVIPLALGGGLILRKATCPKHRTITGSFENILTESFGAFRHAYNLPSRRRKERPDHYSLTFDRGKGHETKKLPIDDHPAHLILPRFAELPGVIGDGKMRLTPIESFLTFTSKGRLLRAAKHYNPTRDTLIRVEFSFPDFLRMLAKIAHGIAVAEFEFGYEPDLVELIEGIGLNYSGYVIGRGVADLASPKEGAGHAYKCDLYAYGPFTLILVSIRLFAGIDRTPTYTLVAGATEGRKPILRARTGATASTRAK